MPAAPGADSSSAGKDIHVGVAGWSYPDWEGIVYPKGLPRADQLRYLAGHVDLIEVNSTFYRPPSRKAAEAWVERVADLPGFFFTAKVHQDVTHRGKLDPGLVRAFHEGLEPVAAAGRLRLLLAQFRWDFAEDAANRSLVTTIDGAFRSLAPLVVEVRHNSWQSPRALEFLGGLGVTVANLDYPTARDSFTLRVCRVGEHAYFRLHGRNRRAWFDKDAGRDATYDYLYSPEELVGVRDRALEIKEGKKTLTIVANNHFRGKEVANALELKSLLSGEKIRVPPGLLEEYPRLRGRSVEGTGPDCGTMSRPGG